MNIDDIDLKKRMLYVYRKGKNDDTLRHRYLVRKPCETSRSIFRCASRSTSR